MQLLGSTTSPYVRRLRLYFALLAQNYQFTDLDIFSEQGREWLKKQNPTLKVPALIDGDICVYDSRIIFRYLSEKFGQPSLSWQQENDLTVIDAANDSLVTLLISKRSGIDVEQDWMFYCIQHERITNIYQLLNDRVASGEFADWDYLAICLYCLLDWADFRELMPLASYPALAAFVHRSQENKGVQGSDPRV